MKVSVAVMTWNGGRTLRQQLESIAGQSWPVDEVVVRDDGSTDDTVAIAREISAGQGAHWRVVVAEKNGGLIANIEGAFALCTGDIIFLSDQDDVWRRDKVERMLEVFTADDEVVVVFSDAEVTDKYLRPLGFSLWQVEGFGEEAQADFRGGQVAELLMRRNVVQGAAMGMRRRGLPWVLPIPLELEFKFWGHDGWIALILSAMGKIEPLALPLIRYRMHGANQVAKYGKLHRWKRRWVADMLLFSRLMFRRIAHTGGADDWRSVLVRKRKHALLALARINALGDSTNWRCAHAQMHLAVSIRHFEVRLAYPDNIFERFKAIVCEWDTGRYQLCSNGKKSVLRDLIQL